MLEDVEVWLEARWEGPRPNAGGGERQMPTALSDVRSVLSVRPSHLQGAGYGIHRAVFYVVECGDGLVGKEAETRPGIKVGERE